MAYQQSQHGNFNGMPFKDLYMLYILENGKILFINNLHATDSMCTSYPKREYDKKKQ